MAICGDKIIKTKIFSFSKPLALYGKADNELLLSNCSKNSTSPFLLHYFSNFRALWNASSVISSAAAAASM